MTLLGHVKAEMTMKYVLVAGDDLQREFHLARSQPRHLTPHPKAPAISPRAGFDGVVDSLLFAQHAIEMYRRSLPDCPPRHRLDRLSNRLTKILCETRKLNPPGITGRDWPYKGDSGNLKRSNPGSLAQVRWRVARREQSWLTSAGR
jgi:hypothetical protein